MRRTRRAPLPFLLLLAATACGGGGDDDGGTGPGGTPALTATDAQDAFDAFLSTALQFSFTLGTASIDDTRSCQRGGSLRTVGTSSNDQQTGRFTADVRQTHRACIGAGTTGRLWTFDGDPDVRLQVTFLSTGASTVVFTGRVRYASNGASGACAVTVTLSGAPSGAVTGTGTMCGQPISATL